MKLKDKIRDWLMKRYGNMNKAAIALDMHPITLHNYANGENMPGAPFLIKLCELGCDMNWLLGDKGELPQKELLEEIERLIKENEELRKENKKKEKKIVDAIRDVMKNQ